MPTESSPRERDPRSDDQVTWDVARHVVALQTEALATLDRLHRLMREWGDAQPQSRMTELVHPDRRLVVIGFAERWSTPPAELSVLAGQVLHCVRIIDDHIMKAKRRLPGAGVHYAQWPWDRADAKPIADMHDRYKHETLPLVVMTVPGATLHVQDHQGNVLWNLDEPKLLRPDRDGGMLAAYTDVPEDAFAEGRRIIFAAGLKYVVEVDDDVYDELHGWAIDLVKRSQEVIWPLVEWLEAHPDRPDVAPWGAPEG